jgi:phosphohistidine phosphatase
MELFLLRHGIAESRALSGRDADRRLTPAGSAELRVMMKRASGMGVRPQLIFASPYIRAMESAGIAAEQLSYDGAILRTPSLTPDSIPGDVWTEVRAFADTSSVLLVSHEPLLSSTLAWLLGLSRAGPGFGTANLACVALEQLGPIPAGKLKFFLSPDGLRGS